jgi:hypothetical protein
MFFWINKLHTAYGVILIYYSYGIFVTLPLFTPPPFYKLYVTVPAKNFNTYTFFMHQAVLHVYCALAVNNIYNSLWLIIHINTNLLSKSVNLKLLSHVANFSTNIIKSMVLCKHKIFLHSQCAREFYRTVTASCKL